MFSIKHGGEILVDICNNETTGAFSSNRKEEVQYGTGARFLEAGEM
ncbi:MAG: hypothetical protein KBF73_01290 [Flavobacteriales bacterium]|nr:hypothetical protein [Flavobacteriales bacterium]